MRILLVAIGLIIGCGALAQSFGSKLPKAGTLAPDFTLKQANGKPLNLRSTARHSKATLVNFWFYACIPCREEFPKLQKLYARMRAKGFQLVSVNSGDSAAVVQKYVRSGGFTFPIVLNGEGQKGAVKSYGVGAFPSNVLINRAGKVVAVWTGFDQAAIEKALGKLGVK